MAQSLCLNSISLVHVNVHSSRKLVQLVVRLDVAVGAMQGRGRQCDALLALAVYRGIRLHHRGAARRFIRLLPLFSFFSFFFSLFIVVAVIFLLKERGDGLIGTRVK